MAKNGPVSRNRPVHRGDTNDELGGELDFSRGGRAGSRRNPASMDEEFPPQRVREAGFSGGETGDGHVTADDLSPETLFHEAHAEGRDGFGGSEAADTDLSEVGASAIGAGRGLDEAEMAERDAAEWDASGQGREISRKHVAQGKRPVAAARHPSSSSEAARLRVAKKRH